MDRRLSELEDTVYELNEEVRGLRGQVRSLQRLVSGDERAGDEHSDRGAGYRRGGGLPASGALRDSRGPSSDRGHHSGDGAGDFPSDSEASFDLVGREFDERASRSRSGGTPGGRSPSSATSTCSLSWEEREAICEEIAAWVRRSLNDRHRGPSGRDRISLASRVWLVFRDFNDVVYNPVKVCRTFAACRILVKKEDSVGDSVFVGLPSDREARRVVSFAGLDWPAGP